MRSIGFSNVAAATALLVSSSCLVPIQTSKDVHLGSVEHAYGKDWKIYNVLTNHMITLPEFLTGERESPGSFQYLERADGKRVTVEESIYSLRGNGKYERLHAKGWGNINVYEQDGVIVLEMWARNSRVTDCAAPPPRPFTSSAAADPSRTVSIFFGRFDPEQMRFFVDEYVPDFDMDEYRKAVIKEKYLFQHRQKYGLATQ